ncbi:hypothetical protein CK203_019422 [Vitis vinifera]|uniref:Uncharacterized protein n=1 Tax=Vitis vinifera TaxID=29760 RepID=A0A438IZ62_VITVI|nr:hypothetical protein CK203_019422 [Vitis vinifera]
MDAVLLLMRNLSINLTSPDFEDHKISPLPCGRFLAAYEANVVLFDMEDVIFLENCFQPMRSTQRQLIMVLKVIKSLRMTKPRTELNLGKDKKNTLTKDKDE